jgi:nucleoside-diphosphate-sugar epimerase
MTSGADDVLRGPSRTFLVTGGGGFVGRGIVRALRDRGHNVVSVARRDYPELRALGAHCARIDLAAQPGKVKALLIGVDGVFHVAAKVDLWGNREDFIRTNVDATAALLRACAETGVRRFVYTSTPSVIANGRDLKGVDESQPYPRHHNSYYSMTKALAERLVLAANRVDGPWTVALRPHAVWGPGDRHLIPTILNRLRSNRLLRIGSGTNQVDLTYIDECIAAHLCAMEALDRNPACRGRAFFVSQGDPVSLWWWIDEIASRHGLQRLRRSVPKHLAVGLALILERWARLKGTEPALTCFMVSHLATHHYFNIDAAMTELGYRPQQTTAEALDKAFPRASQELET